MLNSWKPETNGAASGSQKESKTASTPSAAPTRPAMGIAGSSKKSQSIVDECLTMRGDLESDADILVKGKVLGNISCNVLIVDKDALVEGGIEAKEVVVRGKVKGIIKAVRVRLDDTADVECDIYQKVFAAEEGARIRGSLKNMDELPENKDSKAFSASPNKVSSGEIQHKTSQKPA